MEKSKELIELREKVEDIDGTVFFSGEDEKLIEDHKAKVIADAKKEKETSYNRLRKNVVERIYNPHGTPAQSLMELEDMAMDEGFDPDEIELILHSL